jgi:hypothetical protein
LAESARMSKKMLFFSQEFNIGTEKMSCFVRIEKVAKTFFTEKLMGKCFFLYKKKQRIS